MERKKSFVEIREALLKGLKTVFLAHPTPPSEEMIEDLFEGLFVWGPLNGLKINLWLLALVKTLEQFPDASSDRFYTLVHGIIDPSEIRKFLNINIKNLETIKSSPKMFSKIFGDMDQFKFEEVSLQVPLASEILKKIVGLFTEDEKVVIRFLRHSWSHPTLMEYEPKIAFESEEKIWKDSNKGKHARLMNSLKNISANGDDFKKSIAERLIGHIEEIRSIAVLSKELTYRFGYYEHEIFETWFNPNRSNL